MNTDQQTVMLSVRKHLETVSRAIRNPLCLVLGHDVRISLERRTESAETEGEVNISVHLDGARWFCARCGATRPATYDEAIGAAREYLGELEGVDLIEEHVRGD